MDARLARVPSADELRIAGLTPFSTVDWPGRMTATVFLQGCPWDCFYCHNPALIDPRARTDVEWTDVTDLLDARVGLLDGVVFSGGEPTLQRALPAAMDAARARGFAVGLHTAGAFPGLLARALPHVDWIGLDIKATRSEYAAVTGRANSGDHAWRSLELVLANQALRSGTERPLEYEVRTTAHPAVADDATLRDLGCRLAAAGVDTWAVQRFRTVGVREPLPPARDGAELRFHDMPAELFTRFALR